MSAKIKLKGHWSKSGMDFDICYSYYIDKNRIYLQDDDYGLNRRWYPLENVARVDDGV